ncbi:uncharacterized protein LOC122650206 isoform X2 [Telopea speciosissima]|uniref:uncharacterized protein LOC122650206 isoform X2 n=1 Tax=Telopea speciosissima TaxID=54955 RepID=UPI001CC46F58|nr:uncharacterized protein LOC122650206 isoform X2 [Telopea speciosissima]XP_043699481.1 uncharacterized protein LOC122650206 isoform X2 [Telopea speciosissima]
MEMLDLSGFEDGSDGTDNGASERSSQVPVVGMSFKSENEAYKFYNAYARTKGFGVKKLQVDRARKDGIQGETVNRVFTCVKERLRDDSYKGYRDKEVQYQDTTRMDCKAAMQIKKCPSGWVVTKFIEEHNHELVPSLWYLQRTFDVLVHIAKESKERCNVAVDCLKEAIQKCSHIEVRSTADPDANQGGGPNSQQESIRFINFDYTSFSDPAKTKGWPTSSKPKVWYDQHASKNRNKCGNCDELGHNLRTCPLPLNPQRLKSWKPATWPANSTPKTWYDQAKNRNKCGNCDGLGHNMRTCPLPPNPQRDKSGKAITPATSKPKAWYDQVDNHNKCGNCDALGHNLRTCPLPLNPERSKSQKRHATQSPSNLLGTSSNHRQGELRNEFGIDSRGVGVLATQAALQASSVTVCHPRNN